MTSAPTHLAARLAPPVYAKRFKSLSPSFNFSARYSQFEACSGNTPTCLNRVVSSLNLILSLGFSSDAYPKVQLSATFPFCFQNPAALLVDSKLALALSHSLNACFFSQTALDSGLSRTSLPNFSSLAPSPESISSYSFQVSAINLFVLCDPILPQRSQKP